MINFDNAATTFPKPLSVRRAVSEAVKRYGGNAGRGGHRLAMAASEALYSARETAAEFFGAEPENVVFTMNCTYALNMAIQGVMSGGGHLIISGLEHNSSARPAAAMAMKKRISLSIAEVYPEDERTIESFRSLMREDTKAVVCTLASNVTGQITPYREIEELCRERGICFIADGAQACGVLDIKLSDGINILCTAGHKGLYGPMGTGLLLINTEKTPDSLFQGGTGSFSSDRKQPDILPDKFESGTPNLPGIAGLNEGIRFVLSRGVNNIEDREMRLAQRLYDGLKRNREVVLYTQRPQKHTHVPVISFNLRERDSEEIAVQRNGSRRDVGVLK